MVISSVHLRDQRVSWSRLSKLLVEHWLDPDLKQSSRIEALSECYCILCR